MEYIIPIVYFSGVFIASIIAHLIRLRSSDLQIVGFEQ